MVYFVYSNTYNPPFHSINSLRARDIYLPLVPVMWNFQCWKYDQTLSVISRLKSLGLDGLDRPKKAILMATFFLSSAFSAISLTRGPTKYEARLAKTLFAPPRRWSARCCLYCFQPCYYYFGIMKLCINCVIEEPTGVM